MPSGSNILEAFLENLVLNPLSIIPNKLVSGIQATLKNNFLTYVYQWKIEMFYEIFLHEK